MNAVRTYSTGSNTSPASRSLMYPPSIVRSLSDVGAAAGSVVGSLAESPRASARHDDEVRGRGVSSRRGAPADGVESAVVARPRPAAAAPETEGGSMRVGRVEAFAVRYPESNNDGTIRALTLVRVETDDGLVGWGEA